MTRVLWAALGFVLLATHSASADRLGIAVGYFPEPWGDPFSSVSITRKPLWSALFDPLALVTAEGELLPWLAVDWQQSAPNEWRVQLRENVFFDNGEPLTAESVVAAVAYLTGPAGRATPVGRDLSGLVDAEAIHTLTVVIRTATPDPLLPYKLSLLYPVAAQRWADLGTEGYFLNPAGTGPYTIKDIAPNRVTLTASPTSWRSAPAETLEYLVLAEPAARQAALATGEADIAITALSPDEFEMITDRGGKIFVDRVPAVVSLAYITEGRNNPFSDQRVREAMIHAVNRQGIVDILIGGATRVSSQPAPAGAFGYNEEVVARAYDPDKARMLLRDAGYGNGFAFTMEMPGGAIIYTDVFQQMAVDLARVGIDLTIQLLPQARFLENIQTGDWRGDAMAIPMFTPLGDALYPMRQNSCAWHAAYYCDPAAIELIEAAAAQTDLEQRRSATQAVMRHAHETAQALFVYETVSFVGLGPRVDRFRSDYGFIRYEMLSLSSAN